jgi:hypothetical protein
MENAIALLEKWYLERCNGEWEHHWGISIETLDNPGWRMRIDLRETRAENKVLEKTRIERNESDWVIYWAIEHRFEAACGPLNLSEAIHIFLNWFES